MSCRSCGQPVCCCIKTVTKTGKRGPAGPRGPKGEVFVESGEFTLNAEGTDATGGTLSNPGASPLVVITTSNKAKLVHFNCHQDDVLTIGSYGKDDSSKFDTTYFNDAPVVASSFAGSILVANNAGNGWLGKITAIGSNTYTITFNKIGTGLDIVGQWHAITG